MCAFIVRTFNANCSCVNSNSICYSTYLFYVECGVLCHYELASKANNINKLNIISLVGSWGGEREREERSLRALLYANCLDCLSHPHDAHITLFHACLANTNKTNGAVVVLGEGTGAHVHWQCSVLYHKLLMHEARRTMQLGGRISGCRKKKRRWSANRWQWRSQWIYN